MGRRLCGEDEYPTGLLAVAGYRLPGASRSFPVEPLGEHEWNTLLAGARAHRATGLLRAASADRAFPVTESQLAQIESVHRRQVMWVLSLERELISVVDVLEREGIRCRILKGTAVANMDYADPALRSFADLDILVRSTDIDQAVAVLTAAGFDRPGAEARPGFDRRFANGMTLMSPAGYELDLHRTFVVGPWGMVVDLDDLWDDGQEFHVAGRPIRALSWTNRFLNASYHAALGDWPLRLTSLRDVAEMLRQVDDDGASIRALAASWGAEAVVAAAVADTERLLSLPARGEFSAWATDRVPSRRELAWLDLHARPVRKLTPMALACLRHLPRWRDKVAYARALALPRASYREGRHASATARFRHAIADLRRQRARDQPADPTSTHGHQGGGGRR